MLAQIYALVHQRITIFDTLDHGGRDELSRFISLPAKSNRAGRVVEQILETAEVRRTDDVRNIRRGGSARRIEFGVSGTWEQLH